MVKLRYIIALALSIACLFYFAIIFTVDNEKPDVDTKEPPNNEIKHLREDFSIITEALRLLSLDPSNINHPIVQQALHMSDISLPPVVGTYETD